VAHAATRLEDASEIQSLMQQAGHQLQDGSSITGIPKEIVINGTAPVTLVLEPRVTSAQGPAEGEPELVYVQGVTGLFFVAAVEAKDQEAPITINSEGVWPVAP